MIKIAICDDEMATAGQIEQFILQICERENILVDTDVFNDVKSLVQEMYKGILYDVIYMGIQMENGDGISAAKSIQKIDENVLLIYVSGYDKYAMELFQLDAFEFLLKPIDEKRVERCFLEAVKKIGNLKLYFSYQYKKQEFQLLCMDILFFESKGRKILIHVKEGGVKEFNGKLSDVEKWAVNGKVPFLRMRQSYLVNYHHISSRTKEEIELTDGTKLSISEVR
ncbi:MAG: LytTR family DNA-binding domain-containing protein [Roseburia sp.]|nr:LytTR family DNA-binding domain-containing protein [Roseburia sp.]